MLKNKTIIFFLMISCTLCAGDLHNRLKNKLKASLPLKVNFRQQLIENQDVDLAESGFVLIKDLRTIKWIYNDPEFKVFILKNNSYIFYQKEENQVSEGTVEDKSQKWLWHIICSDSEKYTLKEDFKNRVLYLKRDSTDVTVFLNDDFLPSRVMQRDQMGMLSVFVFENYRKRIKISDKEFDFKVPENCERIKLE